MASSSSNVVGVHYRVGKKIGEGSFGVLFEGTNLLNNQQVAIKFVCCRYPLSTSGHWARRFLLPDLTLTPIAAHRNRERAMHRSCETSTAHTRSS
jgi:serine/threonine protein kinase